MPRVADVQLEEIRQKVDIAELVREFVPELKRAGRHHKARCPFHQERTPSFMVNTDKQIYHCFGCGEGGDAFSFLMKMEGLGFTEAVERLAERAGVRLEPLEESLGPREKERLKLREALAFAQAFYRKVFETAPEADAARRYIQKRGVSPEARERFGIGYAPPDGGSFQAAALRQGLEPGILTKAGLVSQREGMSSPRDFFRARVLYPVRNPKGEVAGFGARIMGDGEPKYLNSPDTPVFSKGRVLYGLYEGLAELRKARRAVLMEGYMDVIAAHQFGLKTACAPLGTAVTEDHAALLRRYADEVVFLFDPDTAGAAAALRGAELLLEKGFMVRVATVPGGLDPDELLHKGGVKALDACLAAALDLPDFKTGQALAREEQPSSPEAKARVAGAVLETVRKASDDVLKGEWVRRLAQRLGVDEASLKSQLARGAGAPVFRRPAAGAPEDKKRPLPPGEEAILQVVLHRPELASDAARVREDDFSHEAARRIFSRVKGSAPGAGGSKAWTGALLQSLEVPDASLVSALLMEERAGDSEAVLDRAVTEGRLLRRYRELHARLPELGGDASLAKEYRELLRRLSDMRLLDRLRPASGATGISKE